ncbi:MAG: TIGR02147 family protein [Proteobacteria bacterium]|nr:MAG: TIGR02147 family protein [Pseudomonadota bacterium]
MPTESPSYRQILQQRLEELTDRNPSYSLRAMARDVGLAPSLLSDVINSKRGISPERAIGVAQSLKLSKLDSEIFVLLVQLEGTTAQSVRDQLTARISELKQSSEPSMLSSEQFQLLTSWVNFPVLESVDLLGEDFNAANVALKLGVDEQTAAESIELLLRAGLITLAADGRFQKTNRRLQLSSIGPNYPLRHYHREMLKLASDALESQSNEEKFVGTATFSIASSDLPRANEILEDAFTRITALAKHSEGKDSIYHLGVQMFRLSKKDS